MNLLIYRKSKNTISLKYKTKFEKREGKKNEIETIAIRNRLNEIVKDS